MLTLIDTVIAFTVIMLLISFLIKGLTSVVKNHVQYYTQNLRTEMERLLESIKAGTLVRLEQEMGGIDWRRMGEEWLTEENLKPILKKLDAGLDLTDLKARLAVHKAALDHGFEKRMKNLSLACGMALCLLLNINAFSIWGELYSNAEVRAKFSSDAYVQEALKRTEAPTEEPTTAEDREALKKQREEWIKEVEHLRGEVNFGIGAIWGTKHNGFFYEFLGSLLTALLASVGAPYLHDLLRALSSLRKRGQPAGQAAAGGGPPTQPVTS